MRNCTGIVLLGVLVVTAGHAEDTNSNKWKSDAELGLVINNGNTRTKNLNAKFSVLNERPQWRNELRIEAFNSSDRDATTGERYFTSVKSDYKISAVDFLFVTANYEDDRFSGYEYQASEALGYGRRLVATEAVVLDIEAGPGARQNTLINGSSNHEGILRAAGTLNWQLSSTASFSELLSTEAGQDSTVSKSETGLKAQVNGDLAMKLTFTVKYTSDVPNGFQNTDTQTAVTLVYTLL